MDFCPCDRKCVRARRCALIRVTCSHVRWGRTQRRRTIRQSSPRKAQVWQRGTRPARGVHGRCLPPRFETCFARERPVLCLASLRGNVVGVAILRVGPHCASEIPFARTRFGRQGLTHSLSLALSLSFSLSLSLCLFLFFVSFSFSFCLFLFVSLSLSLSLFVFFCAVPQRIFRRCSHVGSWPENRR